LRDARPALSAPREPGPGISLDTRRFHPGNRRRALNLAADRAFKRHRTTVKPFEVPTSLMTEGVFALSRNPMYLGMVLVLFGLALFLGTLTPFLICIGFGVLLDYRFIRAEERMLADQFAAEWRSYSARVRRWI
jgi:protein-S-isoprenylcysteine O-methyltransferase Ste14